jgi:uncharacterized membrane protein YfcA
MAGGVGKIRDSIRFLFRSFVQWDEYLLFYVAGGICVLCGVLIAFLAPVRWASVLIPGLVWIVVLSMAVYARAEQIGSLPGSMRVEPDKLILSEWYALEVKINAIPAHVILLGCWIVQ